MLDITVEDAGPAQLVRAARLLSSSLGFGDRDAIPAWLMRATTVSGGLALAATDDRGGLVGFSYAFPAFDGTDAFLYSCGLAVDPSRRGAGIGQRLKLEQRARAVRLGYASIRWTAEPLSAPALGLYLSSLGARMVGYETELFEGLRTPTGIPQDDVTIVWEEHPRPVLHGRVRLVEIPTALEHVSPAERLAWRHRARSGMVDLLRDGMVGTALVRDVAARRSWVRFEAVEGS